jgi:hypothetical protein
MGRRYLEFVRSGKLLVVSVATICVAAVLWGAYLLFAG